MLTLTPLSTVKDIHKGHRAFVLGSGPSLNTFNFEKVTCEDIIFACNQSVVVLEQCDYFCMTGGYP